MIQRLTRGTAAALLLTGAIAALPATTAGAQTRPAEAGYLTAMAGRWAVTQSSWTGPDAAPTRMPDAIAERRIAVGGGVLEERMTAAAPGDAPFTRSATLNYNAVGGVFEYASIDTRMPQQMHYGSQPATAAFGGPLRLRGGTFVADRWGEQRRVAFAYRVELTPVEGDRQTLRLFLRPIAAPRAREFLAFRYDYRRLP